MITESAGRPDAYPPAAQEPMAGKADARAILRSPVSAVRVAEHGASAWHGLASPAWHGLWHGAPGNPSTASAISAIARGISAASADSARDRTYGKEKVYGSIP
jgi:hypothetical protein